MTFESVQGYSKSKDLRICVIMTNFR